jgi:hypothetical protein
MFCASPLPLVAQAPPHRPAPTRPAPPPSTAEAAWFNDPRWWAIGVTGFLSLLGLGLQYKFRRGDRREDLAGEQFDEDIKDAVKDAYKELRILNAAVADASDIVDKDVRTRDLQASRDKGACKTFNFFSMSLAEADHRLGLRGKLSDINADLEDAFFTTIASILDCTTLLERRAATRKISVSIISAITRCDAELKLQRSNYVSPKACKARRRNMAEGK